MTPAAAAAITTSPPAPPQQQHQENHRRTTRRRIKRKVQKRRTVRRTSQQGNRGASSTTTTTTIIIIIIMTTLSAMMTRSRFVSGFLVQTTHQQLHAHRHYCQLLQLVHLRLRGMRTTTNRMNLLLLDDDGDDARSSRMFLSSSPSPSPSSDNNIPPEIGGGVGDDDIGDDEFHGYHDDEFLNEPPEWELQQQHETPQYDHQQQQNRREMPSSSSSLSGPAKMVNPFPFPQPKSPVTTTATTTTVKRSPRSSSLLDEYGFDDNSNPAVSSSSDSDSDPNRDPGYDSKSSTPVATTASGSTSTAEISVTMQTSTVVETSTTKATVQSRQEDDADSTIDKSSTGSVSSASDDQRKSDGTRKNTFESKTVSISISAHREEQFAAILEHPDTSSTTTSNNSNNRQNDSSDAVVIPQISGGGDNTNRLTPQDTIESLKVRLGQTEQEIWTYNKDKKFNLNSPKQVSEALFGRPDMSTNKNILEGMAGQNIFAKLILEHRHIKSQLNKSTKRLDAQQKQQQQQQESTERSTSSSSNNRSSYYNDAYYRNVPVTKEDPVLLVDLSSWIFRAYYSMPPIHRPVDGMPVGAVMGFCNMLNRLVLNDILMGKQPRVVLCCDADTSKTKTFRHEMYSDYKGHRPPLPLDLIPQFGLITKAAKAYGIPQIQAEGYEADDVMATLATQACFDEGLPVRILSGDKDLMQLITNRTLNDFAATSNNVTVPSNEHRPLHNIHMIDPTTMTPWTHDTVVEKWGVPAYQLGDVLALAGDTADNVPGVPGIGPKIAAQLMQEFGSLEELLGRTDEVPQKGRRSKLETYKEQALLSKDLVRLVHDLDMHQMQMISPDPDDGDIMWTKLHDYYGDETDDDWEVGKLRMEKMNAGRIIQLYDEMGFVTIKERLLGRLKRQSAMSYGDRKVFEGKPATRNPPSTSVAGQAADSRSGSTTQARRKTDYEDASPFSDHDFEDIGNDELNADIDVVTTTNNLVDTNQQQKKGKKKKKKQFTNKKWGIPTPDDFNDVPF